MLNIQVPNHNEKIHIQQNEGEDDGLRMMTVCHVIILFLYCADNFATPLLWSLPAVTSK